MLCTALFIMKNQRNLDFTDKHMTIRKGRIMIMDREDYEEIKQAIAEIFQEYNVKSLEEWDAMDDDDANALYENLKAGVLETFGLDDDEMAEILDEVLEEISET